MIKLCKHICCPGSTNNSNSTNIRVRHANEWFMNHKRILTYFLSKGYYDYIIAEAPKSKHARLVDKPKDEARRECAAEKDSS